ncbi:MAG: hypothetical protein ABW352_23435 [Polyangiales bacterium]
MQRIGAGMLCLAGLVGCAASGPHARGIHYQEGDAQGSPRVESLPSLDVAESTLTAEMRMARLLSAECLNLAPPHRPNATTNEAIEQWSDAELKRWMQHKHASAEAARRELDKAAVQSPRQRIMAGAMVGLVYEDVARNLLALPTPTELISEPEIAAMYVDLLRSQATPYLVQARAAYTACAGNAEQVAELHHWSSFCLNREDALPPLGLSEQAKPQSGEVTVSVSKLP